jgi:hypothetical protein
MPFTDTLNVELSKEKISQNDSLFFDVRLPDYLQVSKLATLHLWIEEIKTGRKWHYRYPMINGELTAALKVDDAIAEGNYAFNFSIQKLFFSINGKIMNPDANDEKSKSLNYVLIAKGKESIVDLVKLKDDMSFNLSKILFQDTAFIIFSRSGRKKNDLQLAIDAPLDSAFVPDKIYTKIITVCKDSSDCNQASGQEGGNKPVEYAFKLNEGVYKTLLPEVVLSGKSQKDIKDFEKENVTGVFTGYSDFSIDGISSDEIAKATDLFIYLSSKIPGIKLEYSSESGLPYLSWRNKQTDIFLNEIKMDTDAPLDINPADIALIKVYRPGNALSISSGEGGTVCIYLKNGIYGTKSSGKYSFSVKGYTGVNAEWK